MMIPWVLLREKDTLHYVPCRRGGAKGHGLKLFPLIQHGSFCNFVETFFGDFFLHKISLPDFKV